MIESDVAQSWQALRESPVQPQRWFELARLYKARDLLWQAAYAARQAVRCDAGLAPRLHALEIGAWQDANTGDAQLGRAALEKAAQLTKRFSLQVKECPGDWLTWLYLARLIEMRESGSPKAASKVTPAAQDALQRAKSLEPLAGESLHWMGVWRLNAGDASGAVTALSGLLDNRPMRHGSMMYLGEALLREGRVEAAQKAFSRASLSGNPDFLLALAARVYGHNYWNEAIDVLNKALSLRPASVPILLSLAKIQSEVYSLADCQVSLGRVKALDPDNAEARLLEAGLMGRMGDAKGHLANLEASYAASGDPLSRVASSIAMTLLYQDELAPGEVAERHRRLCAPIEKAFARTENFSNPRTTGRRLRVGYVTGDIHRQHPVNIFMLPVLLRHDHAKFEVCVYHTGTMHDEYTRQAKASSDRWMEAAALDDTALRRAIMADGIDVLVDLAGHTSSHRLGVFAMRAAPVQATFLGYPNSTGLSTIDWLIGDAAVAPAEHAHLFSEGIAQLPDCVWCWAPVDSYPLPKARGLDEPVVFGSFNNAMKLSPRTIALWARVLEAVPDSRLLLKAPSLRDEMVQKRFADLFAGQGVARGRLTLRGPSGLAEMMQEYGDVDIGLDPIPYNGGTTTLQALWMGVPVVCLAGGNFVGRMGASFMRTLGRPEWVAADEAGYVKAAERLARDIQNVRAGRARLREAIAGSKLCDIQTYVKNFEAMLREMWAAHCAGDARRVLRLGDTVDAAR